MSLTPPHEVQAADSEREKSTPRTKPTEPPPCAAVSTRSAIPSPIESSPKTTVERR